MLKACCRQHVAEDHVGSLSTRLQIATIVHSAHHAAICIVVSAGQYLGPLLRNDLRKSKRFKITGKPVAARIRVMNSCKLADGMQCRIGLKWPRPLEIALELGADHSLFVLHMLAQC